VATAALKTRASSAPEPAVHGTPGLTGGGSGSKLICPVCYGPKSYNARTCRSCRYGPLGKRTLGELREKRGTFAFHAKLRGLARTAYKRPLACAACGYDRHVDICHIRDVADFPPEATVDEVNDPSNLIALDKRCHWEFDHGYLLYIGGCFVARDGLEPSASRL
jgi:ribosomal protein L40E